MKRLLAVLLSVCLMVVPLAGCGTGSASEDANASADGVTVTLYAAASLGDVLDRLITMYHETNPDVTIVTNYDSSGTLLEGIKAANGTGIDLFFSAAQKQMDELEADGLVEEGTRVNVVNNQLCLITYPGSDVTASGVTSLSDLANASGTVAICDGTVPAGKYTRQALLNLGILSEDMEETKGDVSTINVSHITEAFGGIEITEPKNVTAARQAVQEQSCVLGTCYLSDTYDVSTGAQFEDIEVLETVSYDLTGNIIYPLARVVNSEADEATVAAAQSFYEFLISDEAKAVYDTFLFDTNVE